MRGEDRHAWIDVYPKVRGKMPASQRTGPDVVYPVYFRNLFGDPFNPVDNLLCFSLDQTGVERLAENLINR